MTDLRNEVLVSADWLAEHLKKENHNLKVLDATWQLPVRDFREDFLKERIPGALFFDIDKIADTTTKLPHMLPTAEEFEKHMENLGVSNDSHVVIYDRHSVFVAAARVWWTFKIFGHDPSKISVLDGGLNAWKKKYPVESGEAPQPQKSKYKVKAFNKELLEDMKSMQGHMEKKSQIVDARPSGRFKGADPEPRPALHKGHIPGSVNIPHTSLLEPVPGQDYTTFLPTDKLREKFTNQGVDINAPVVHMCGSGVTASVVLLAQHILGGKKYSLYDGSWTEWGKESLTNAVAKDV